MTSDSMKAAACSVEGLLFDNWFDPIALFARYAIGSAAAG